MCVLQQLANRFPAAAAGCRAGCTACCAAGWTVPHGLLPSFILQKLAACICLLCTASSAAVRRPVAPARPDQPRPPPQPLFRAESATRKPAMRRKSHPFSQNAYMFAPADLSSLEARPCVSARVRIGGAGLDWTEREHPRLSYREKRI